MRALVRDIVACVVLAASGTTPLPCADAGTRTVVDMADRRVTLPNSIVRIATIGSVPVLNSFLLALGEAANVVNGLPAYASTPRYKYHLRFIPGIEAKPRMQSAGNEPNLEELLAARPDVVFTLDRLVADRLEKAGIPAIFLAWRQPEDVKRLMRVVGDALNRQAAAADYVRFFDATVQRVTAVTSAIPHSQRPRVLYCNLKRLTQDQLIGEWWIQTAGGVSVTNNGRSTESFPFSLEQMFAWDPDILVVANPDDLAELHRDSRFGKLKAMKSGKVYVAPIAAHLWTNRTVEQPLTLLWAAQKFYPNRFADLDLVKEMCSFYSHFFHYPMTEAEAREIVSGRL